MKTVDVSEEEMGRRTARFGELKPYKQTQNDAKGIPPEAMEMVSAKCVFPVMSPEGWAGRNSIAPVKGAPGITISLAESPPGDNILEPLDFISVPPGVSRNFKNISEETGYLFVVIQTPEGDEFDNVAFAPSLGEEIADQFGADTVERMNDIGFKFDAGIDN
jgi:hypothetical protein